MKEHMPARRVVVFTDVDGYEFPVAVYTYTDEAALTSALGWAEKFIEEDGWRPNGELKLDRIEASGPSWARPASEGHIPDHLPL